MVGSSISHYKIVGEVGRGGMGVVYRAEDTRLGRTVAMKFLADHLARDETARRRFMQEARTAAALTHANIATLYDVVEVEGRFFITMEFVDGRSLKEVLEDGLLPVETALDYATQVARGLERAHDAQIIHRDIKPANIMVTDRGELKILDFGLAQLAGGGGLTQTGSVVGTAAYMSPEQVRGESLDRRTDLWSLGVVLYELLTGRRPFDHAYDHAMYYAILNEEPKTASEIRSGLAPGLDQVLKRLLAKELEDRYASAAEVIADLFAPGSAITVQRPVRPAPKVAKDKVAEAEGERRMITVMYCELDGFGDLSEELDPEDLRDLMAQYHAICHSQIERFDGRPGGVVTGGLFAYFGYPTAHEDDARRAIRCAMAIRAQVAKLPNAEAANMDSFGVRVGIHTGLAIVGTGEGGLEAYGKTSNLPTKMTGLVGPGTIAISEVTRKLSTGYFEFKNAGAREIHGFADQVPLFEVVKESEALSRLDTVAYVELTPLVGRQVEMGLLRQRWKQVTSGEGYAVLVSGEAGIGKSRLIDTFRREATAGRKAWHVRLFGSSFNEQSAFYPLAEFVRQTVWPRSSDGAAGPVSDLEEYLKTTGLPADPFLVLFADLLGVALPADLERPQLAPFAQKQKTMQGLLHVLTYRSAEQPGVIAFEDVHWADPSTQEWIDLLIGQLPAQPILAVFTTRPATPPAWLSRAYASEVTLNRLTKEDMVAIAEYRSKGKKLPKEILDQVASRTDGVPLFAEELTRMLLDSGMLVDKGDRYELTGPLDARSIPETLHGSLTARLDRLQSGKRVAQKGAVIGRQFTYELLQAISEQDDASLEEALAELVEAELIFQRGFVPQATYNFKHSLIQDAAYSSLLKARRRELHKRVANALTARPSLPAPEVVAHHYTEAGLSAEAIPLWQKAGQQALARNAHPEAVSHLTAGLNLVSKLPDGTERDLTELGFLNLLGPAVMMSKSYSDQQAEDTFNRAHELCSRIGEIQPLVYTLQGLAAVYLTRGDYKRAFEIGAQSLEATEKLGDPGYLLLSHIILAYSHFFSGDPARARRHAETVLELYDPEKHDETSTLGWGHFNLSAKNCIQLSLHVLGYADQALQKCQEALDFVKDTDNHISIYHGHLYAGLLYLMRRDWEACRKVMSEYLPVAVEYGDPFYILISTVVHNLALRDKEDEEKFRGTRQTLEQMHGAGFALGYSMLLGVFAEGHLSYGNLDLAGQTLDEALEHLSTRDGEFWEAEIYRLKGDLLRESDAAVNEVSQWYDRALETARRQNAKSLELRAATSKAEALSQAGMPAEAHDLLSNIYEWFTEGAETHDLRAAKALIHNLTEK